jgi:hypothetical protein
VKSSRSGGAYLRQEGLYSSQITEWRKLHDAGVLAGKSAGAKVGRPTAEQDEIARLRRQLDVAERRHTRAGWANEHRPGPADSRGNTSHLPQPSVDPTCSEDGDHVQYLQACLPVPMVYRRTGRRDGSGRQRKSEPRWTIWELADNLDSKKWQRIITRFETHPAVI